MTNRKYFIIIIVLALMGLIYALIYVIATRSSPIALEEPFPPAKSPFKTSIFGVGIVEPNTENIYIGTALSRIVDKVLVKAGDKVNRGDILFTLEDRDLEAEKKVRESAYKKTLAELQKLKAMPRSEEVVPFEAQVKSYEAELELAKNQYEMAKNLGDSRAISQEEFNKRLYHYQQMKSKYDQAKADLDKIKAGSWKYDIDIAEIDAEQALANLKRTEAEINRTIIRSPIDGEVLQVKIHEGELPPADSYKNPLMILGNVDLLHLRVDIDQFDAPYFQPEMPAVAYLQGNANVKVDLHFVRIEPFLSGKQNLTNDILQKIDSKVLSVIYSFHKGNQQIYVGQQMDAFIEVHYPKSMEPK